MARVVLGESCFLRSSSLFLVVAACLLVGALAALALCPQIDLAVSGLFADAHGFAYSDRLVPFVFEKTAFWGARLLALFFAVLTVWSFLRRRAVLWLSGKSWLFLLLALLIGPGLIANVGFKDHWGRARPHSVIAFGGDKVFTPALEPSHQCKRNCSFVSGDGAFGFFLPCFAYVVPLRRSRRAFWVGIAGGVLFGGARIVAGAHFLSDVAFAAALMLCTGAALHALLWSAAETKQRWLRWLTFSDVRQ